MKILTTLLGLTLALTAYQSSAHAEVIDSAESLNSTDTMTAVEATDIETGEANDFSRPGDLCYGEYEGQFNNGVRARFSLQGRHINIQLGNYYFSGYLDCRGWGSHARVYYHVTSPMIPGDVYGDGDIDFTGNGARISVQQNNNLWFNGWRLY